MLQSTVATKRPGKPTCGVTGARLTQLGPLKCISQPLRYQVFKNFFGRRFGDDSAMTTLRTRAHQRSA